MADDNEDQGLLSLTTEIVASFVGNNPVTIGDLPAVIAAVFDTLRSVNQGDAEKPAETPVPAVPIKKSIGTDYLTPDQYRQRWGLAKTYPMVAPAYAAQRSALAKQLGLGRKAAAAPSPASEPTPVAPQAPRRAAGRRKKTG